MTRVDLYLLKGNSFSDQIDFCCRLTEKAFSKHPKIHIQTAEAIQSEALDKALWSFKTDSFLPHVVGQVKGGQIKEGQAKANQAPITIDTLPPEQADEQNLLISLSKTIPNSFLNFERLCLVILNIESDIQAARDTYKKLKKQGIEVHIQDMR